jgi:hypothetical protein
MIQQNERVIPEDLLYKEMTNIFHIERNALLKKPNVWTIFQIIPIAKHESLRFEY